MLHCDIILWKCPIRTQIIVRFFVFFVFKSARFLPLIPAAMKRWIFTPPSSSSLLLDSASLLTSFLTLLSHMSPSLPPSLWGADQFTASLQGVTTPHPYIPSVLTLNTFWWGVGRRGQEMIFQACEAIRTPETKAAVANVIGGGGGRIDGGGERRVRLIRQSAMTRLVTMWEWILFR